MRRFVVLHAILAAGLAACQVNDALEGQFRCSKNPSCPDDYACVAGLCVGKEPGLTPCAQPDLLATTFDDPKWLESMEVNASQGSSVAITGGELVLQVPATNNYSASVESRAAVDLRDREVVVEATLVGGRYAEIGLEDPSRAQVYMGVADGKLYAYSKGRKLAERPYVPAQDRWWRLRSQGTTLFWESSPDALTWTTLGQDVAPVDLAWVTVDFGLESSGTAATARFSALNPTADGTARWCPAVAWRQSFSDNVLGPEERQSNNNCTQSEADGLLTFTTGATGESYCGRYSARPVDARDATFTFEVSHSGAPAYTTFTLLSPDRKHRIQVEAQDDLSFDIRAANLDVFSGNAVLDAPNQRFWRVSLSGANVRFETSADGATWETRGSTSVPTLDASAMFIERETYVNSTSMVRTTRFGELR